MQLKDDGGVSVLSIDFEKFRKMCDVMDLYVALEENQDNPLMYHQDQVLLKQTSGTITGLRSVSKLISDCITTPNSSLL